MNDGFHRGRSFSGHELEDECPCPQEPCGLVNLHKADPGCEQHGQPRSMRQGHASDDCPGGDDLETVLQLAHEVLINTSGRCPMHSTLSAAGCETCKQARRVRKAIFAFGVNGIDVRYR